MLFYSIDALIQTGFKMYYIWSSISHFIWFMHNNFVRIPIYNSTNTFLITIHLNNFIQ